jgi:hypothetical protein
MSLEDCEKFYLEEFRKLLLEKKFEYSDKMKELYWHFQTNSYSNDLIEKNLSEKKYLLPYKHIPYFTFTYPITCIDKNKRPIKFTNIINTNDTILIWNNTNEISGHLTCQIITKNGYSFSFGLTINVASRNESYKDIFGNFESLINTPDIVFENNLMDYIINKKKQIKLIAVTKLNNNNLNNLNKFFLNMNYLTYKNIGLKLCEINSNLFKNNFPKEKHDIVVTKLEEIIDIPAISIENKNKYINLIKEKSDKYLYLRPCYYFFHPNNTKFCRLSSKKSQTINCTSLIQKIFDEIVACTGSSIVSIPRFCYQKKTTKRVTCPKVVSNTSRKTKKHI